MNAFIAQFNINLLPTLVLVLICLDIRKDETRDSNSRMFFLLLVLHIGLLLLEPVTWLLDGPPLIRLIPLNWCVNTLFFAANALLSYVWLLYFCRKTNAKWFLLHRHRKELLLGIPCLLFCVILLVFNGKNGVFYIDESFRYRRGTLSFLPYAIAILYLLTSGAVTLSSAFRGRSSERRRQSLLLACSIIPPVLAAIVQLLYYGWWLARPVTALMMMILYLKVQRQDVSSDSLTGLNNRKQMNRYLSGKWRVSAPVSPWCLIMIDIDRFKSINDTYGHTVGDEALCRMAECIKQTSSDVNAFLCRYGGDEFVIILDSDSPAFTDAWITALRTRVSQENTGGLHAYTLSFSVGYAFFDPSQQASETALLALADQRMYQNKQEQQLQ